MTERSNSRVLQVCLTTCLAAAGLVTTSQASAADASGRSFEIYGFAMADFIHDFQRLDPQWDDAFRPSKIPTEDGVFGGDGQSSVSVKQSRFGVKGTMPTDNLPINFKFEFDLFGTGVDAGQTTFRLRHAYGEWGSLLAGQTNSLFMDGDVFPNTIDYWGPTGMVFYRNVQIRWTPVSSDAGHFAIAIERPGNDVDAGNARLVDPVDCPGCGSIQNDEEWPDVTAQWRTNGDWGHLQLAGILRWVGYESREGPDNEPKGHETGWGINVTSAINMLEKDKLLLGVVYGEGIASYMNDGGMDLAPQLESSVPLRGSAKAVPLTGVMAYYDHYWNDSWSSSIGYSLTEVDNTNFQDDGAYHKGDYASANLLYYAAKGLMIGGELMWGKRTDNDGATGDDVRFQFSVKYDFGIKF
jgi:hypothetical protein